MNTSYYIALLLFCFGCLGIILIKTIKGSLYRSKKTYIVILILSSAFFITSDLAWMIIEGNGNVPIFFNYFLNTCYFLGVQVVSYVFFWYSESIQNPMVMKHKSFWLISLIPCVILLILLFSTPSTKLIFYVDSENQYQRGILYPVQIILSFSYPLLSVIKAMFNSNKKENFTKKSDFYSLFKFILFPTVGLILQFFMPVVPYCSIGIVLGILWLYLDNIDMVNYVDALTDIYNKKALTKKLSHDLQYMTSDMKYYLIMLDVDKFKHINDYYGHAEGDLALMIIARVLRDYCRVNYAYVARYGGDEFTILLNCRPHQTIFSFCLGLEEAIKECNVEYRRPYEIRISYGYYEYNDSIKNIPDFIAAADEKLYECKNANKEKNIEKTE